MNSNRILHTKFFGQVACGEAEILHFPAGLPGFEKQHFYVLLDQAAARPLVFLQSSECQDLCFAALPLQRVDPDYRLALSSDDIGHLGVPETSGVPPGADFLQLALVSLEGEEATANLLAPVVIWVSARKGVQAIQWESQRSPRTPLRLAAEKSAC